MRFSLNYWQYKTRKTGKSRFYDNLIKVKVNLDNSATM